MSESAFDPTSEEHVEVWDELTLWSSLAGSLMLDHVPMAARRVLDLGCGAGFPVLELADRLGPGAWVVGLDPWEEALRRADRKRRRWPVANADLVCGDGAWLPFGDSVFDLVVSNLGINNFDQPELSLREARRVLRAGGTLALTTNRAGHMRELYEAFDQVLSHDSARERLRAHVERRGTVESLRRRLVDGGFEITALHEREAVLRFANAHALFEHHLVRIGFRAGWEEVAGDEETLARLRHAMDALHRPRGEIRLTVPFVYLEGRRSEG